MVSVYEDHELLRDLKEGSDVAYRELYNRFHELILFTSYQRVKNRQEAEDIASECFIAVFEARQGFQSIDHVKNYLFKKAFYVSADYLHKPGRGVDSIEGMRTESLVEGDLEERIIRADYIAQLRRMIETLPARQRATILALAFDEKKYTEVARDLGLSSVKGVKKYRKRGILNLIKRIQSTKAAEAVFLLLSLLVIKK